MARPPKYDERHKDLIQRALDCFPRLEDAADWLGIGRTTLWELRHRLDLVTEHDSTHSRTESPAGPNDVQQLPQVDESVEVFTKPVELQPQPNQPHHPLTARDFTGSYRGDVGGLSFAGTDGLLARYRRLRDS
jgi:hypothetical protein